MNVFFELGAPDGLRSRFLADAADFERWLLDLDGEFTAGYSPALLARLADISLRGAEALVTADPDEAEEIDRLTHDYWNFCTMTGRHGERDVTPAGRHQYPRELATVLPSAGDEVCNYYRRLFAGDSLAICGGHAYRSVDGVFRWSWLLPHEVSDFYERLQEHAALLDKDVAAILAVLRQAKEARSSLLVSVA